MPTPSDSTDELPLQIEGHTLHTTCPPEIDRPAEWRVQVLDRLDRAGSEAAAAVVNEAVQQQESMRTPKEESPPTRSTSDSARSRNGDVSALDVGQTSPQMFTECQQNYQAEDKDVQIHIASTPTSSALDVPLSSRLGVDSSRFIQTHTSSMLRAGSKFRGTQRSEASRYDVEVDIQTVDISESSICGYLKIKGLTPEYATLTTCFEGEIIGPKYTFQTRHEDWGASDKDDMRAWARFPAWRAVGKQAKKSADFHYKNSTNRENMFMRWKEKFLVPDHRVREISGASFEGFYYICFNQVLGTITGIYYHSKTDTNNKVQQLELKWVNDHGCYEATEFR